MAEDDFEFYKNPPRKTATRTVSNLKKPPVKKSKIKLAFRISSFSLAAILAISGGVAIRKLILKGYIPENFKAKGCYISLDESFNLQNYNASDYDFVLLNLPNWEENISDTLINNLKICHDNKLPIGVCLNPSANSPLQAETEALRLLSITEEANVQLPIIINVNEISSSESALQTIIDTLKKKGIASDRILLSGNEQKLKALPEIFKEYKKYSLSNREQVTATDYVGGNFNTGAIINDVNAYLDQSYMPEEDVQEAVPAISQNDAQCLGVDVSAYQGNIDWVTAQNYIDFAIIRVANFNSSESILDIRCQYNIAECKRLGIPFGLYVFSTSTTKEEANEEWDYLFNQLDKLGVSNNDLVYPIYIDVETTAQEAKLINHDSTMVDTIEVFCQKVEASGFKAGIYINQSMAKLLDYTDPENRLGNYHRWIANYGGNNNYKPFSINELANYQVAEVTVSYDMQQITDRIIIPGIGKSNDPYANETVDCNIDTSGLAFSDHKTLG